ncbi:GNAT family N-acetyltransferase [Hyphococcus sp.]|jgi:GNAT superfamily N-acetyltransferase|uniref:GNAT family N-acetyltransferase n=1 Tax=Hyphococcus sp. TaxID=2038636 RepID=UPI003D12FDBC
MIVTIRPASAADIPLMQSLERDAAQAFRAVGYDFCADGPVRTHEEHERGLEGGAIFIAETDGEAAGFILLWVVDRHAHLTEISIAERFQRRGIGRALIEAGEDWARERGFDAITLTTFRDVAWNAPFYRSLGYAEYAPGGGELDLAAVQAEEAQSGYAGKPRITMKKAL